MSVRSVLYQDGIEQGQKLLKTSVAVFGRFLLLPDEEFDAVVARQLLGKARHRNVRVKTDLRVFAAGIQLGESGVFAAMPIEFIKYHRLVDMVVLTNEPTILIICVSDYDQKCITIMQLKDPVSVKVVTDSVDKCRAAYLEQLARSPELKYSLRRSQADASAYRRVDPPEQHVAVRMNPPEQPVTARMNPPEQPVAIRMNPPAQPVAVRMNPQAQPVATRINPPKQGNGEVNGPTSTGRDQTYLRADNVDGAHVVTVKETDDPDNAVVRSRQISAPQQPRSVLHHPPAVNAAATAAMTQNGAGRHNNHPTEPQQQQQSVFASFGPAPSRQQHRPPVVAEQQQRLRRTRVAEHNERQSSVTWVTDAAVDWHRDPREGAGLFSPADPARGYNRNQLTTFKSSGVSHVVRQ